MRIYEQWYDDSYTNDMTFWQFIESLREYSLIASASDVARAYIKYFIGNANEMENRLTKELYDFITQGLGVHISFQGNATNRICSSAFQMVHKEVPLNVFYKCFHRLRPNTLRIPEDDRLNTLNLLQRVHMVCSALHSGYITKQNTKE